MQTQSITYIWVFSVHVNIFINSCTQIPATKIQLFFFFLLFLFFPSNPYVDLRPQILGSKKEKKKKLAHKTYALTLSCIITDLLPLFIYFLRLQNKLKETVMPLLRGPRSAKKRKQKKNPFPSIIYGPMDVCQCVIVFQN